LLSSNTNTSNTNTSNHFDMSSVMGFGICGVYSIHYLLIRCGVYSIHYLLIRLGQWQKV